MGKQISQLFEADTKARWRMIAVAAIVTAISGQVMHLNQVSLLDAQLIATVLGTLTFCAQVLVYVANEQIVLLRDGIRSNLSFKLLKSIVVSVLIIAASWMLTYAASFCAPRVEALILQRRLQK